MTMYQSWRWKETYGTLRGDDYDANVNCRVVYVTHDKVTCIICNLTVGKNYLADVTHL